MTTHTFHIKFSIIEVKLIIVLLWDKYGVVYTSIEVFIYFL